MATYYINGSGAPYTDPQGNTWGIGNDVNAGTISAPKATYAAGIALVSANNDVLKIAPATYTHSAAFTQLTLADKTGIIMEGADSNNLPIIDMSGLTGAYGCYLRGQTTIRYLALYNANLTAGWVNNSAAFANGFAGADIIIHDCVFYRNAFGFTANVASSINLYNNKFIENANYDIYTGVDFKTAAAILMVAKNKFLGHYIDKTKTFIAITGTNGDTDPTIEIYNNEFAGASNYSIYCYDSYDGTIMIKNNNFRGNRSYNIVFQSAGGSIGTREISNNAYAYGGWPNNAAGLQLNLLNCTDSAPVIATSPMYKGHRGNGYVIIRKDDSFDIETVNLNDTEALAAQMAARGLKLTLALNAAGCDKYSTWTQAARIQSNSGVEICNHGYSHSNLNNDTNNIPFTVTYGGAGDCNLTIVSAGVIPNDTETLTLTETVTADNISINLVTGAITGDTTSYDLTTWQGVRNYLHNKAYLSCSAISGSAVAAPGAYSSYPDYALSRTFAAVDYSPMGGDAKNIELDTTRHHYYELVYGNTLFAANGITLSDSFVYPFFDYDSTTINSLLGFGYRIALGELAYADWTLGQQLSKLQMFEIGCISTTDLRVLSDVNLRTYIVSMCEALQNRLSVMHIMTHGNTQNLSTAQWDIVFDTIAAHSGVQIISASEFADIITGGDWTTADSGITYTRSFGVSDNITIMGNSPCRDAGVVIAGLTTDFEGKPVPMGSAPDIGAYEFPVPSPMGLTPGLGLGGKIPPLRRRR